MATHFNALILVALLDVLPPLAAAPSCGSPPQPAPPAPTPTPSPLPPQPPIADACDLAGARLEALQCRTDAGAPIWETPAGIPFSSVCKDARRDGREYPADCISGISECSDYWRCVQ